MTYACIAGTLSSSLVPLNTLKVWLDALSVNTPTTAYQNLVSTVTGTSGLSALVCSGDESLNVFAAMSIRANGTDIYTVQSVSTSLGITTIVVVGTLSSSYAAKALAVFKISQENDRSGNANNATQGTATAQPIYYSSGINSLPVVNFGSSSTTKLSIASSASVTNLFFGGGTLFCVFNARSVGGGGGGRIWDKTSGTGGWQIITNNAAGGTFKLQLTQVYGTTNGMFITSTASLNINTNYVLSITYDSSSTSNVPVMRLNGVQLTLTNTAPTGSFISDTGSVLLKGNNPAGIRAFDGLFATDLIYGNILSSTTISQIEHTLGSIYGISIS